MYQGKKVACLIMAAGSGTRMGKGRAKQFREVGGKSVIERTLLAFANHPFVDDILIVTGEEDRMFCNSLGLAKGNGKLKAVCLGGETREDSVWNGLKVLAALRGDEPDSVNERATDIVLIQDAARPFTSAEVIDSVTEAADRYGAAVPCVPARDTIKVAEGDYIAETLPRDKLFGAQTPQGFRRGALLAAMRKGRKKNFTATDDSSYVEKYGGNVRIVPGDVRNIKITTIEDMATAEMLAAAADEGFRPSASYFLTGRAMPENFSASDYIRPERPAESAGTAPEGPQAKTEEPKAGTDGPQAADSGSAAVRTERPAPSARREAAPPPYTLRVGEGYDVHMLVPGRDLVLGGLTIPFEKGLEGHSDADVMTHAAMDALLGAASLGDIGQLFPDKDPAYEGVYSLALLEVVRRLLEKKGFRIGNLDITVAAQAPKLAPYIPAMRANYAKILRIPESRISVKATTTERLGFVGRGEGIAATAVCLLFELPEAASREAVPGQPAGGTVPPPAQERDLVPEARPAPPSPDPAPEIPPAPAPSADAKPAPSSDAVTAPPAEPVPAPSAEPEPAPPADPAPEEPSPSPFVPDSGWTRLEF